MIFDVPPGRLDVDDQGRITAVRAGDRRYLSGGVVGEVIIGGRTVLPTVTRVAVDDDEVEVDLDAGDGLTIAVRHSFAAGWGWRVRLSNDSAAELIIDAARLDLAVGPEMVAHPIAAAAEAELVIRPAAGDGPILAGRLATGSIAEITDQGLITGPLLLPAGAGFVLTWQWTWYDDVARLTERRRGIVPWPAVRTVGEPIDLRGDPDAALMVPDDLIGAGGMMRGPGGELTELVSDQPGRYRIEERSARGTVTFDLGWAPPLESVLGRRADRLPPITGPGLAARTAADGIVLHMALSAGTATDPDEATDALELITAGLLEDGPRTGLDATLLCLEHHRTGERDPLDLAANWILTRDRIEPGLGFAVTQACLARVIRGQSITGLIDRAATLAGTIEERPALPLDAHGIAELELLAAIHRNLERPAPAFRSRLRAAGPYLGSGEVAPARPALDTEHRAARVAVLRFADEQAAIAVGRDWAASPSALAEAAAAYLLGEAADSATSVTLAWLALGLAT